MPKQTVLGRRQKLSKARKQNIKKPFISEENKKNIKYRIIRDNQILFEQRKRKEKRRKKKTKT